MSKHRCPLCKRRGWKAKRRVVKLWREAIKQGIPVLDYTDSPAVREALRREILQEISGDKLPDPDPRTADLVKFGQKVRQRHLDKETPWYAMAGYAGGELLQPVEMSPEAAKLRLRARKKLQQRRWREAHPNYYKEYYARKKAAAEAPLSSRMGAEDEDEAEFKETALDYAEKQNEKLARDRAYQRKYYAKNKERIDRLRKQRAARQTAGRRSPNTGAKANGH